MLLSEGLTQIVCQLIISRAPKITGSARKYVKRVRKPAHLALVFVIGQTRTVAKGVLPTKHKDTQNSANTQQARTTETERFGYHHRMHVSFVLSLLADLGGKSELI